MNTLETSDHLLVIDPCSDTQARIAEQLQGLDHCIDHDRHGGTGYCDHRLVSS
jgi:hypothetical protein